MNDSICFIKLLNEVKWLLQVIWQKKDFCFQMVDDVPFFLTIMISMSSCVAVPLNVLGWGAGLMAMQSTTRLRREGKRKRTRNVPCSQGSSCWKDWGHESLGHHAGLSYLWETCWGVTSLVYLQLSLLLFFAYSSPACRFRYTLMHTPFLLFPFSFFFIMLYSVTWHFSIIL